MVEETTTSAQLISGGGVDARKVSVSSKDGHIVDCGSRARGEIYYVCMCAQLSHGCAVLLPPLLRWLEIDGARPLLLVGACEYVTD